MNTAAFAYVVRKVMNRGDTVRAWGRLTVTRRGRLELTPAGMSAVVLIGVAAQLMSLTRVHHQCHQAEDVRSREATLALPASLRD